MPATRRWTTAIAKAKAGGAAVEPRRLRLRQLEPGAGLRPGRVRRALSPSPRRPRGGGSPEPSTLEPIRKGPHSHGEQCRQSIGPACPGRRRLGAADLVEPDRLPVHRPRHDHLRRLHRLADGRLGLLFPAELDRLRRQRRNSSASATIASCCKTASSSQAFGRSFFFMALTVPLQMLLAPGPGDDAEQQAPQALDPVPHADLPAGGDAGGGDRHRHGAAALAVQRADQRLAARHASASARRSTSSAARSWCCSRWPGSSSGNGPG